MRLFDLYRSGYALGNQHGQYYNRRRANWELVLTHPLTWLPGVDQLSFISGYHDGYRDGAALSAALRRIQ